MEIQEKSEFYFVSIDHMGRWVLRVDNSMLFAYKKCPRYFLYKYVKLQNLKGMPGALSIGKWWSMVLDLFYTQMKKDQVSMSNPVGISYCSLENMIEMASTAWKELDMNKLEVQNPKAWKEFGGIPGAAAMAKEYWERIGHLDLQNFIIASEAGFCLRLYEDEEMAIDYCGKPDLIVFDRASGFLAPLDHKTREHIDSNAHKIWKPHAQTAGYIWATGELAHGLGYDVPVDRAIINVCGRAIPSDRPRDGVKKPRFLRVYPTYNPDEIEEWKAATVETCRSLLFSLKNINEIQEFVDLFPMYDNSCHLYGGCDYRRVDSVPGINRDMIFKSDYLKGEPWIPVPLEEEDD